MRYRPPNKENWKGRSDGINAKRIHESIQLWDKLQDPPRIDSGNSGKPLFGILGFACDEGVKRNQGNVGASQGPNAIRKAFAKLPALKQNFQMFDFGDITCEDGNLEAAQKELAEAVAQLHRHGVHTVVLGGGHEVAWGHYQGLSAAHPDKEIAIVNFDAHFDLRPLLPENKGSSGTSFLQIANDSAEKGKKFHYTCLGVQKAGNTQALFDKASELKVRTVLAEDFHLGEGEPAIEVIDEVLNISDQVYVSVCLDVFATPYAPGVSAPQPLGLYPWHVIPLLQRLGSSGKVISLDIAELCPARDREDTTAQLAAGLLYHYMDAIH